VKLSCCATRLSLLLLLLLPLLVTAVCQSSCRGSQQQHGLLP
jgi:hypothetical protein